MISDVSFWKCGTTWGKEGSILDIVVDFKVAFFGTDSARMGNYEDVKCGDLLCLAQGTQIVAIAKVLSTFDNLSDIGSNILPRTIIRHYEEESQSNPVACKISDVLWLKTPIAYNRRGRFCKIEDISIRKQLIKPWEEYLQNNTEEAFDIQAKRKFLTSEKNESALFSGESIKYTIPVYQRPYAWEEVDVLRLLDDILDGFSRKEKKFIGSIQVSALRNLGNGKCSYELIDGQQRLTTIIILLRLLGEDYTNCLRTTVNSGSAQRDWDDFCDTCNEKNESQQYPLNKYIAASKTIQNWIKANEEVISLEEFKNYIKTQLIFVVIQTLAGLSKIIQIFDVINTAGMDLNASDLFKIRFYEYLTKTQGENPDLFNQISKCYQRIEEYNRGLGYIAISMAEVMSFYQKIIVASFDLNVSLFEMSSERFFDRLFDNLINGKAWEGFNNKNIELTLDAFNKAIEVLIRFDQLQKETPKLELFRNFLWETRYGEVVYLYPPVLCYFHPTVMDNVSALITFTESLFKRLVPPSLYYAKVVNEVRSTKMVELLKKLNSSNDFWGMLSSSWEINGVNEKNMLIDALNYEIASAPRWKNLSCKIVEFLLDDKTDFVSLKQRLFNISYDIEHIQSYTDENDRDEIWASWKEEINRLGNLMLLEFSINRSVQNNKSQKVEAYSQSQFVSVRKVKEVMSQREWDLETAQQRREELTKEICNYICSEGDFKTPDK